MAIVNFDSKYYDNKIEPNVSTAKSYLLGAKNKSQSLSVPTDFKYYNYLVELDVDINRIIKDLDKFNDWVKKCKKTYKDISDKYEEEIEKIKGYDIKKHNKI